MMWSCVCLVRKTVQTTRNAATVSACVISGSASRQKLQRVASACPSATARVPQPVQLAWHQIRACVMLAMPAMAMFAHPCVPTQHVQQKVGFVLALIRACAAMAMLVMATCARQCARIPHVRWRVGFVWSRTCAYANKVTRGMALSVWLCQHHRQQQPWQRHHRPCR